MIDGGLLGRRFGGLFDLAVALLQLEFVWNFVMRALLTVLFGV